MDHPWRWEQDEAAQNRPDTPDTPTFQGPRPEVTLSGNQAQAPAGPVRASNQAQPSGGADAQNRPPVPASAPVLGAWRRSRTRIVGLETPLRAAPPRTDDDRPRRIQRLRQGWRPPTPEA